MRNNELLLQNILKSIFPDLEVKDVRVTIRATDGKTGLGEKVICANSEDELKRLRRLLSEVSALLN
jgi:hypothetical protein